MEWMLMPLRRYAQFSGRSRRKEYWMFFLFVFIVRFVLIALDSVLGLGGIGRSGNGLLSAIFSLAVLVPSIAVGVRRLHDTDRSGWWLLVSLLAALPGLVLMVLSFALGMIILGVGMVATSILLLVFLCQDGTHGDNRFGPDPKGPNLTEVFA